MLKNIFDISGRAMAAQLVRLNTVASNLANAGTIASTKEEAFRALKPVFQTTYADQLKHSGVSTVDVVTVTEAARAPEKAFMPHHPSADADGFVYRAAVDENEEMVEMVEASLTHVSHTRLTHTAQKHISHPTKRKVRC